MKITFKLAGLLSIFLVFSLSTFAAEADSDGLKYDSEKQVSIALPTDPGLKWQQYLSNSNIQEGTNYKKNGQIYLIASGQSTVGKPRMTVDLWIAEQLPTIKHYYQLRKKWQPLLH